MCNTLQVEEDSSTQVARSTQAEQDQYEMQVRAANIVSTQWIVLSILVYNLFLDRQRNIGYTPQYFHEIEIQIFQTIRISDWVKK